MAKKKNKNDEVLTQQAIEDEHRIRKAFVDKDWAEIKSANSWVIFKVMAEFVEGFEKLSKIVKKKSAIIMLSSSLNPHDVNRSKKYANVKKFLNKPLIAGALCFGDQVVVDSLVGDFGIDHLTAPDVRVVEVRALVDRHDAEK